LSTCQAVKTSKQISPRKQISLQERPAGQHGFVFGGRGMCQPGSSTFLLQGHKFFRGNPLYTPDGEILKTLPFPSVAFRWSSHRYPECITLAILVTNRDQVMEVLEVECFFGRFC